LAYVSQKQQENQREMELQQGAGLAPEHSSRPLRPAPPGMPPPPLEHGHKLVAPERGQKPPMPPMRGVKGNAQDALAFFMGGYQKG
jgi:hypothetical protein